MNAGNVVGGHKANLNNPNTSEESKQHSREVLDNEYNGGEVESKSDEGKNPNNVYVAAHNHHHPLAPVRRPHSRHPFRIEMLDSDADE